MSYLPSDQTNTFSNVLIHVSDPFIIKLLIDLPFPFEPNLGIHRPPTISNTHQMLTRVKQGNYKPKILLASFIFLELTSMRKALKIPK